MKRVVLVSAILLLVFDMEAQFIGFSAGIEYNNTYLIISDEPSLSGGENYSIYPSFGLSARLDFGKRSYINSGVFYGNAGNEIILHVYSLDDYEAYDLSVKRLKIPCQYGIEVLKLPFQIGIVVGPLIGIGLDGRFQVFRKSGNQVENIWDYDIFKDSEFKHYRLFLGMCAGLQLRYRNFGFEVLYSGEVFLHDIVLEQFLDTFIGIEALTIRIGYEFDLSGDRN